MAKYTAQQIKILKQNPYTLNATKNKLYLTKKFKEDFWERYQMGIAPRKILAEFGYDLSLFGQKQIDSMVQSIKNQAMSGNGFSEGNNRQNRMKLADIETEPKTMEQMQHELLYLRQEVEFLKKIVKADNRKRRD